MIFYYYQMEGPGVCPPAGRRNFRSFPNFYYRTAVERNEQACLDYQKDKRYLLLIATLTDKLLEACVAVETENLNYREEWETQLKELLPNCTRSSCEEVPATEFKFCFDLFEFDVVDFKWVDEILNLDYSESFVERLIERIRTEEIDPCGETVGLYGFHCGEEDFSIRMGAKHGFIQRSPKLNFSEIMSRAEKLPASPSLKNVLENICAGKNSVLVNGHPVHYHIATRSREAKHNIRDLLCEALRSAGQVPAGKIIFFQTMQKTIIGDERFRRILDAARGSIVVFDLSCDMSRRDCQNLVKYISSVIEEYGDSIRFIITESEVKDNSFFAWEYDDYETTSWPRNSYMKELTAKNLNTNAFITISEGEESDTALSKSAVGCKKSRKMS